MPPPVLGWVASSEPVPVVGSKGVGREGVGPVDAPAWNTVRASPVLLPVTAAPPANGKMTLARRAASRTAGHVFLADADCLPQTLDVLRTRAEPLGIDLRVEPITRDTDFAGAFGVLLQYPGASGAVREDLAAVIEAAHAAKATVAVAADILALTLLTPPGELGADIALGSTQRFGVPMFYGGPHAAYIAVCDALKRQIPGRPRRRVGGRRRKPRVPPRPASPRAAHSPREGHQQHLHRAGPAGRDRRHVRGLSRPRGPGGHRAASPPARRDPGGNLAGVPIPGAIVPSAAGRRPRGGAARGPAGLLRHDPGLLPR